MLKRHEDQAETNKTIQAERERPYPYFRQVIGKRKGPGRRSAFMTSTASSAISMARVHPSKTTGRQGRYSLQHRCLTLDRCTPMSEK